MTDHVLRDEAETDGTYIAAGFALLGLAAGREWLDHRGPR